MFTKPLPRPPSPTFLRLLPRCRRPRQRWRQRCLRCRSSHRRPRRLIFPRCPSRRLHP